MAGRKNAYLFFPQSTGNESNGDEFDESDVWGSPTEPVPSDSIRTKPIPSSRSNRRKPDCGVDRVNPPASLPVNVPGRSKILEDGCSGGSNRGCNGNGGMVFEGGDDGGVVIPPHELLWRNRAASFSVHEGIGRTLKGRDLSSVRNAIWEKMGFQD